MKRGELYPNFSRASGTPSRSRHILIMDDEPAFSAALAQALAAQGHKVDTALDGFEGVRLARASAYDLVLCDLLMPGRGGLEALDEASKSAAADKWVFVTGASDAVLLEKARATGRPILRKPLASHDIEALLR